jgi:hypothetical protein
MCASVVAPSFIKICNNSITGFSEVKTVRALTAERLEIALEVTGYNSVSLSLDAGKKRS